jgi:YidC/Oxa1 family membrane protein insertase
MTDQRNLILAIVVSVGIILAFQFFVEAPRMREAQKHPAPPQTQEQTAAVSPGGQAPTAPSTAAQPKLESRAEDLASTPRLPIDTSSIRGSIPLVGGRIDDVKLADYHVTVDPKSPAISLLNPAGSKDAYFAEFGWVPQDKTTVVPDQGTRWESAASHPLTPTDPVVFRWSNGHGLEFGKHIAIDDRYMLTVTRSVANTTDKPVTLYPFGLISRWGTPQTMGYYILHEGPIGVLDGSLHEPNYKDLVKAGTTEYESTGGWIGFTDKYWLAAVVPDQKENLKAKFRHVSVDGQDRYQVDFLGDAVVVPPGQSVDVVTRLFAGAKQFDLLNQYKDKYNIPLFDYAIDFGWFFFLTRPILITLDFFYHYIGNYGLAILLLTLCVKILFFPLANKSYRAMSKMKKLQPEMQKLRERFGDDKAKMNQELMALYKKEKVNPMAGCLPIAVQIPVFFSLYKVLFVNIEMRHAPFFGWIKDLSAPDPTTVFNLFGLIPWTPPHMLMIGAWPLAMGVTMFLQQKLNPTPADPTQAKVMMFLPVIFTFLFATFPAGLVVYWTWNNLLSITQQWVIMRRMGVKVG